MDPDSLEALPYKAERKKPVFDEEAQDEERINNLYVKHIPEKWTEEDLRREFAPFGTIKSLVLKNNQRGPFAFICYYEDGDLMAGPRSAAAAIKALNGKVVGSKPKKESENPEQADEEIKASEQDYK